MTGKGKPGVMIYFDLRQCLQRLSAEQKGQLLEAIFDYGEDGKSPVFDDPAVGVAWDFIKPRIDRDSEAYADKVEKARAAVNSRWAASHDTPVYGGIRSNTDVSKRNTDGYEAIQNIPTTTSSSTSNPNSNSNGLGADKPPRAPRFTPPTVEEVEDYCRERGNRVVPQGFIDYYQSKGWMIGRTRMKDWRAAVRAAEGWERWNKPDTRDTETEDSSETKWDLPGIIRL